MFDTNGRLVYTLTPVTAWHCSTVPRACPHTTRSGVSSYSLRRRRTCFPCVTHTADLSGCTYGVSTGSCTCGPDDLSGCTAPIQALSLIEPCQSHCVARQEERRSVSRPSHSNSHTRPKEEEEEEEKLLRALPARLTSSTCAAAPAAGPSPSGRRNTRVSGLGVRVHSTRSFKARRPLYVPQQKRRTKNPSGQVNLHAAVVLTGCVGVGAQFTILFFSDRMRKQ
jgi:hypothetical protein